MHFSVFAVAALLSAPFLAFAQQQPNPFKIPPEGISATGGQPLELAWNPTTQGTVSLILRSGSATHLDDGTIIASGIQNSGTYTWTPATTLTRGSDYTVEIVDDEDPTQVNYTPHFVLDTPTTAAQSTSQVTLGASSVPTSSGLASSALSSSSASSLSSSYMVPIHNTFTHRTTGATGLTTLSGSASSMAATPASASSSGPASVTSAGLAARATGMAVGVIGVALGALAL